MFIVSTTLNSQNPRGLTLIQLYDKGELVKFEFEPNRPIRLTISSNSDAFSVFFGKKCYNNKTDTCFGGIFASTNSVLFASTQGGGDYKLVVTKRGKKIVQVMTIWFDGFSEMKYTLTIKFEPGNFKINGNKIGNELKQKQFIIKADTMQ